MVPSLLNLSEGADMTDGKYLLTHKTILTKLAVIPFRWQRFCGSASLGLVR